MEFNYIKVNNVNLNFGANNRILIFTKDNTMGKTTIMRSIIFGLGNLTKDITDINIKVDVEISIGDWVIKRSTDNPNIILLNDKLYNIANEIEYDLFTERVYSVNSKLFNKLLPTYYIDQDFGWKTINIGKIHPTNDLKMNLSELVHYLIAKNNNFEIISKEIEQLSKERANLTVLASNWTDEKVSLRKESEIKMKYSKLNDLQIKKQMLEIQKRKKKKISHDLSSFANIIKRFNSIKNTFSENDIAKIEEQLLFETEFTNTENKEIEERLRIIRKKISEQELVVQEINLFDKFEKESSMKVQEALAVAKVVSDLKREDVEEVLISKGNKIDALKGELSTIKSNLQKETHALYTSIFKNISNLTGSEINFSEKNLFSRLPNIKFNKLSGVKKGILVLLVRKFLRELAYEKVSFRLPLIIDTINHNDPSAHSLKKLLLIAQTMISEEGAVFAAVKGSQMHFIEKTLEMETVEINLFKKQKPKQLSLF